MLISTRGIILTKTKFGESSIICKVFTQHYGVKSYIAKGVRKKRASLSYNLFVPLYRVEIIAYNKEGKDLNILKELSLNSLNQPVNYQDPRKSAIAMFFAEVLSSTLGHDEPDEDLFSFIFSISEETEEIDKNLAAFIVYKLWRLTRYLGIMPALPTLKSNCFFHLNSGEFMGSVSTEYPISSPESLEIIELLSIIEAPSKKLTNNALEIALNYLKYHISFFKSPKSLEVLKSVFK